MTTIIGIKVQNRIESATEVQEVLTKFGCYIKTRIGLHNVDCGTCSPFGIILIEIIDHSKAIEIQKELLEISDIELQEMIFEG